MEGSHRNNIVEYRQFSGIARCSIGELKYHLMLAKGLDYIANDNYVKITKEINNINKMLYVLIDSLTQKTQTNSKGI